MSEQFDFKLNLLGSLIYDIANVVQVVKTEIARDARNKLDKFILETFLMPERRMNPHLAGPEPNPGDFFQVITIQGPKNCHAVSVVEAFDYQSGKERIISPAPPEFERWNRHYKSTVPMQHYTIIKKCKVGARYIVLVLTDSGRQYWIADRDHEYSSRFVLCI